MTTEIIERNRGVDNLVLVGMQNVGAVRIQEISNRRHKTFAVRTGNQQDGGVLFGLDSG